MKTTYIYIFFLVLIITLLLVQAKVLKINITDTPKQEEKIMLLLRRDEEVINLELEEYLIGVLACEMPALFHEEALKAGSIAARTFALEKLNNNKTYIFNGDTSDQCYNSIEELKIKWDKEFDTYYKKIKTQVENTKGKYITYKDKIIKAYYFSVSNGYTENVESVFNEDLEYLKSVESPLDKNTKGYTKTITIPKKEFLNNLGIKEENITIKDIVKNDTGRVEKITINEKIFTGIEIRKLLNLRSTDFEILVDKDLVTITTKGYGHGVGMSQYGANELAKTGYDYEDIIKYYYKDVKIKDL